MKPKISASLAVLIFAVIMYLLPFPCIFIELTGYECLGCGMTRALLSALRLRFAEAFSYHKMFWSVPLLYISFLRDGRLLRSKVWNAVFHILIAVGFVINWVI